MKFALPLMAVLAQTFFAAAETMSGQPLSLRPNLTSREAQPADPIGQLIQDTGVGSPDRSRDKFFPKANVRLPIPLSPAQAKAKPLTVVVTSASGKPRLVMKAGGQTLLDVPVSLGKPGHLTVRGCYQPFSWDKNHKSNLYPPPNGGAPMGNSIFFYPAQALHIGAVEAASHGCVHMNPGQSNAAYKAIVKDYGIENTSICIN
jgi:hypothetical protein